MSNIKILTIKWQIARLLLAMVRVFLSWICHLLRELFLVLWFPHSLLATRPPPPKLRAARPRGFVFGRWFFEYVTKQEGRDGHLLLIGGAGSGKSACLAIPSLLVWEQRVFAIDIKGELWQHTGFLRPSAKVFNPTGPDGWGYDPYYLLARSRNPAQDAREIALALVPRPIHLAETFWANGAANLLTGAILHLAFLGYSFIETITYIQSTPVEQLVMAINHSPTPEARLYINQMVGMEIKTLAGIYAELSNQIMVFATDPDVRASLSKKQVITPQDLEAGHDIFLHIPEDKLEQWRGLLTLIVNQFIKHFECHRRRNAGIL